MVMTMIGKRFHQCLSEEAKIPGNLEKYYNMSDYDLVHNVCRKERLTFFNFLRMNAIIKPTNEEALKEMINKEY